MRWFTCAAVAVGLIALATVGCGGDAKPKKSDRPVSGGKGPVAAPIEDVAPADATAKPAEGGAEKPTDGDKPAGEAKPATEDKPADKPADEKKPTTDEKKPAAGEKPTEDKKPTEEKKPE